MVYHLPVALTSISLGLSLTLVEVPVGVSPGAVGVGPGVVGVVDAGVGGGEVVLGIGLGLTLVEVPVGVSPVGVGVGPGVVGVVDASVAGVGEVGPEGRPRARRPRRRVKARSKNFMVTFLDRLCRLST